MRDRAQAPVELWLLVVGVIVYSVAPLLPWFGSLRFHPHTLFAAATALGVIAGRSKKAYWATVAIFGLSIGFPFLNQWLSPGLHDLTLVDIGWSVLLPIPMLGLLFSPRVRRYLAQPSQADEVVGTRCNWCNRSEGDLEKVVVDERKWIGFRRAPEPTEYWVHPEHEAAFVAWHGRKERHGDHLLVAFLGTFGTVALVVPIGMILGPPGLVGILCGALLVAFGIAYLVFPIGDRTMIRWLGLRRALAFGRWTGVALVLLGVGLLLVAIRSS